MSGFSFGTPAPASTQQPLFGAPAPAAAPTFGAPATAPTFGTPATAPTFGTPATAPAFGTPATAPTFGTPAAAPTFGTPAAAPTFGAPAPAAATGLGGFSTNTTTVSLFGTNTATTSAPSTGFNFSTPATTQAQPQQTGFNLGLGNTGSGASGTGTGFAFGNNTATQPQPTSIASGTGTGFSFGGGTNTLTQPVPASLASGTGFSFGGNTLNQPATVALTSAPNTSTTGTVSFGGGLGGVPGSGNPRISTLAIGSDPATVWNSKNDNRALQEMPVPLEILMLVEELKTSMKKHKTVMLEVTRASDSDIEAVAEQIEDVRLGVNMLTNTMHKQELMTVALIKDMQELGKDMDLLAQTRDVPAIGYGGSTNAVTNFLYQLLQKYSQRMQKYKEEIEKAEFMLRTITDAYNLSAKDLWDSLSTTKDTTILLAAQIQQLHEEIRSEMAIHKHLAQFLPSNVSKQWTTNALAASQEASSTAPPLDRLIGKPSTHVESLYNRTYSLFGQVPSLGDPTKAVSSPQSEIRTPSHDLRMTSGLGGSAYSPAYHPSAMGSYLGPTSPVTNAGLKRSKK